MPPKKKCPKVVGGNTDPDRSLRVRWFPNFTSYLATKPVWNENLMKYLCYGEEICPTTKRKHWQGCVYFYDKCSIRQAQKLLDIGKSHMETYQKSDCIEDCFEYCKKDEKYTEFGTKPEQGKRTDLNALKDDLLNTDLTCDDICIDNPMMYHQYGRTLNKIEEIKLRRKFRNFMTKGVWYYGETGTGKSHHAYDMENFNPMKDFVLTLNDGGFWDGYTGQENVIINEFKGQIQYGELMDLVDKYPKSVKIKGKAPLPFISKKITIATRQSPYEIYKFEKDLSELERRFEIIELTEKYI